MKANSGACVNIRSNDISGNGSKCFILFVIVIILTVCPCSHASDPEYTTARENPQYWRENEWSKRRASGNEADLPTLFDRMPDLWKRSRIPDLWKRGERLPDLWKRGERLPDLWKRGERLPDLWKRGERLPDLWKRGERLPDLWKRGERLPDLKRGERLPDLWKRGERLPDLWKRDRVPDLWKRKLGYKFAEDPGASIERSEQRAYARPRGKARACWFNPIACF